MKVTFEVDTSKLFGMVYQHGSGAIAPDIIGVLLTGEATFNASIRLALYGIEPEPNKPSP